MSIRNSLLCLALLLPACSASSISSPDDNVVSGASCPSNVYRHDPNGWIMHSPTVHFVFWGAYWQSNITPGAQFFAGSGLEKDAYHNIWTNFLADPLFIDRLDEYGIQSVQLDSTNYNTNLFVYDPTTSVSIKDGDIPTELNSEIQAGQLPVPTNEDMFVVLFPPNASTPSFTNDSGYHNHAKYGGTSYTYAVIKYFPYDQNTVSYYGTNMTVSHEMYEAWTDPDCQTGYYDATTEQEIGDLCNWLPEYKSGNSFEMLWSRGVCQCK